MALLAPERIGFTLDTVPLNPAAEKVGALTGIGWLARAPDVRVNIYVFARQEQGIEVGKALQEMVDGDGYYARAAVNGALMFFAVTDTASPEARARLDDLMAAFAGLE